MSAGPRPSSSATTATSTAEASGALPSAGTRRSRHPAAATAASSRSDRPVSESSATGPRTQPVDHLCGRVAEGLLLRREPDVHQDIRDEASRTGVHSSRSGPPQHLPRGESRNGLDEHDVAEALVGRERPGDPFLELVRCRGPIRIELHCGDRHLARALVDEPEDRTVEHGRMSPEDLLELGRRAPGTR